MCCNNTAALIFVLLLPVFIAMALSSSFVIGLNIFLQEKPNCSLIRQEQHQIPKCTISQCTTIANCTTAATIPSCNDTKIENFGTCCFENNACQFSCDIVRVATVTIWNHKTQIVHEEQKLCSSNACMGLWLQQVANDPCWIVPYHVPWLRIFVSIIAVIVLACIGLLICK